LRGVIQVHHSTIPMRCSQIYLNPTYVERLCAGSSNMECATVLISYAA
jgi:hypothetical protein